MLKFDQVEDTWGSVDCEPIGQGDTELEWQQERLLPGTGEHCEASDSLRDALAQIGVDPI